MKRRVITLSAASLLLAVLLSQLNHYLAPWQIHLWCGGLFITFVALRLGHRTGATVSFLAGLLLDAQSPVPFGTQGLLFLAGHATIFAIRARAPREEPVIGVVIALIANLALFLALSFFRIDSALEPARAWLRGFADLLASQLLIVLIAPWFFAVQARLLGPINDNLRNFSRRAS